MKACKCKERQKEVRDRKWVVLVRYGNYSAFNGYKFTPSDYSLINCHKCGSMWRTKAQFVMWLKDGEPKVGLRSV